MPAISGAKRCVAGVWRRWNRRPRGPSLTGAECLGTAAAAKEDAAGAAFGAAAEEVAEAAFGAAAEEVAAEAAFATTGPSSILQ